MDWLLDFLGLNKGKATQQAAEQNKQLLGGLETKANGILDTGAARTGGYLTQANDLAGLGPNANGIIGDALGLGGADGNARALSAFQTGPGYDFLRDQGEQSVMRNRAAIGGLQSGQTDMDLMKYGTGLADQTWNTWFNNLTGAVDRNVGTLGNLATWSQGDTATRLGLAGDITSGYMGANNQVADGKEASQGGLWDLLDNVAGVAGSVAGLNFGGGGAKMSPAQMKAANPWGGYGSYR